LYKREYKEKEKKEMMRNDDEGSRLLQKRKERKTKEREDRKERQRSSERKREK
jgi:hypothetical protein